MLNFSSNNPGFGNHDELKAKLGAQAQVSEPVEEEVEFQDIYEEEPDDYNYQPELREVSEQELKNLSAIQDLGTDRRVYIASVGFFVAALIGAAIGFTLASSAADKAEVTRKSAIASVIKNTVESKLAGFEKFSSDFNKLAEGNFSEAGFNTVVPNYSRYNFMLDISSEVSAESILLIEDKANNPLKSLREYSMKTMILTQLLSTHVNETRADAESIIELQSKGEDTKVMFAMQVLPDAVYYLATDAPRGQYANGVISLFTFKDVVENDAEASEIYSQLKVDYKWSEAQRMRRDYQPANKKEAQALEGMDLPNHLIYRVLDRNGTEIPLFADEVILVDRELLFGQSANALERYKRRNAQIQKLLEEAKAASTSISGELNKFIVE
jgi:hypothetical protein